MRGDGAAPVCGACAPNGFLPRRNDNGYLTRSAYARYAPNRLAGPPLTLGGGDASTPRVEQGGACNARPGLAGR